MIPVQETIDITCSILFSDSQLFNGFIQTEFRTFLSLTCQDTCFLFNNVSYLQVGGVSMGSPLGPIFAAIFLGHHELIWLRHCLTDFKPTHCHIHVDYTLAIFKELFLSDPPFCSI